jgi:hypothetical protein
MGVSLSLAGDDAAANDDRKTGGHMFPTLTAGEKTSAVLSGSITTAATFPGLEDPPERYFRFAGRPPPTLNCPRGCHPEERSDEGPCGCSRWRRRPGALSTPAFGVVGWRPARRPSRSNSLARRAALPDYRDEVRIRARLQSPLKTRFSVPLRALCGENPQMWKTCQEGEQKSKVMTPHNTPLTSLYPQSILAGLFAQSGILNLR